MTLELWIAFCLASTVVLMIPGPTVVLVVSYALGQGRGSALSTVPGVALGDLVAMSISLAGAGVVLATSAMAFTALKLIGAVYLIWMGWTLWKSDPKGLGLPQPRAGRQMFWSSFVVTALNPKSIVFFIAFVPQFVVAEAPLLPQFAILTTTFVGLATVNVTLWALAVGHMRDRIAKPSVLRWINRIGGSALIAAGAVTALARRAA